MCPFQPRISRISFYFPYSLDKTSPILFCAFTSHVIAASSEMKKKSIKLALCTGLCALLSLSLTSSLWLLVLTIGLAWEGSQSPLPKSLCAADNNR